MSYEETLKPWAVVCQEGVIDRFKTESDADGHCQALKQRHRGKLLWVAFKPAQPNQKS
jgi:hypothetical protein